VLTGSERQEGDELFTTLSTTTRKVIIDRESFLISDTVGFISKLPAYLIEAFKSTLEELLYNDAVLLVVDVSDPIFDLKKKFSSCKKTLNEIGVEPDNVIYILNKSDLIEHTEINQKVEHLGLKENKKWIAVSAKTGDNTERLKQMIKNVLATESRPILRAVEEEKLEKVYGN